MRHLLPLTALLVSACAAMRASGAAPLDTPISVRSHNASEVDVYLLCGDREARWLGTVSRHGTAAFAISPAQRPCLMGLNFFLVVRGRGRGYWAGPIWPTRDSHVQLVIEKYAGLSSADLIEGANWGR